MIHLIVQASKYLMIFLFLVYTFECFHVFKFEGEEEEQKHIYHVQRTLLFLFHFDAFLVLYITTKNFQLIGFYLMQVISLRQSSEHIICFTSMHPSWFSIICVCYLRLDLLS